MLLYCIIQLVPMKTLQSLFPKFRILNISFETNLDCTILTTDLSFVYSLFHLNRRKMSWATFWCKRGNLFSRFIIWSFQFEGRFIPYDGIPNKSVLEWPTKQKNCAKMAGAYQGPHFSVDERVFMILKCRETSYVLETRNN